MNPLNLLNSDPEILALKQRVYKLEQELAESRRQWEVLSQAIATVTSVVRSGRPPLVQQDNLTLGIRPCQSTCEVEK